MDESPLCVDQFGLFGKGQLALIIINVISIIMQTSKILVNFCNVSLCYNIMNYMFSKTWYIYCYNK